MGNCLAVKADAVDEKINQQLKEEKRRLDNVVKLLLLGPGESGKSTVFKQLKLIQTVSDKGFTDQERSTYKHVVHSNCVEQMRLLVRVCLSYLLDAQNNFERK